MQGVPDIDWTAVDTVLLDMDGTILDLAYDNYFWRRRLPLAFARRHGLAPAAAQRELLRRFTALEGRLEWYCLDYWSQELALDVRALKRATATQIRYLPGAPGFLARARARGLRLVLVTNAHPDTLAVKLERTGLAAQLDAIHSSHDFAMAKEVPEFWQRLATRERFDPARTLLLDDSLPVLRSAKHHGLQGLVTIGLPDTTLPARQINEFSCVARIADLFPDEGPGAG
ncbi:MAG: GMP/IMP nucleotidase [Gammaproteobacteria bacterium]|nr:GMP/IMP nucleotidase [Gammaproteobacteria bacterium]